MNCTRISFWEQKKESFKVLTCPEICQGRMERLWKQYVLNTEKYNRLKYLTGNRKQVHGVYKFRLFALLF